MITGAFEVLVREIIKDPNINIHKLTSLAELFPFWSNEQIRHKLYRETEMTIMDADMVFKSLLRASHVKYAQLFLQEIFRDPNIILTDNVPIEQIDENKLHLHVMRVGGIFGEILKKTAQHLEDGVLTVPEIDEEIELYRDADNGIKSILKMLLEKRAEKNEMHT